MGAQMYKSTLFKISSVLFLLFATHAYAYDFEFDSFSTSNWSTGSGWGTCSGSYNNKPCISNGNYFSNYGVSSGDVVFSYTFTNIYKVYYVNEFGNDFDDSKTHYFSLDAMTGPRNNEQGNKTESLGVTIYYKDSNSNILQTDSWTEYINNTSFETFVYEMDFPTGTNHIQVIISGRDNGYWNGNYGAVISGGSVLMSDYDPTSSNAGSGSATPVYSSGITNAQSTKRSNKLNDTAAHGMEAHVNITGGSNTVYIDQHDAAQYLELTIIGNSNTVDIDQSDPAGVGTHFADVIVDGNSNTLDLIQQGNGSKTAFIGIDGNSNTATINQKDSGNHYLQLDLIGDGHDASILQEGSGNHEATVELSNGGGSWDFDLHQQGSTSKEYSLPHNMSDGSTTSGTCYVSAGCSLTVIQSD